LRLSIRVGTRDSSCSQRASVVPEAPGGALPRDVGELAGRPDHAAVRCLEDLQRIGRVDHHEVLIGMDPFGCTGSVASIVMSVKDTPPSVDSTTPRPFEMRPVSPCL
jgi:hypothetical protein